MKKWLWIFCLCMLAVIVTVYFLIPTTQNFNNQTTVNCTGNAVSRQIINKGQWKLWWPGKKNGDNIYSYKNYNYRIEKILLNGFEATVFNNKDSVKGFLQFEGGGNDSTQFIWTATNNNFSSNPFKSFAKYFQENAINNNVKSLLADLKKYFDVPENIYGMKIVKQKVPDSSLIAVKSTFSHYPTTQEIYDMVHSLQRYIKEKGGEQKDYPMLHVNKDGPATFEVMVAVPTIMDLPSNDTFQLKKMFLGSTLMAEVKGGMHDIMNGEQELNNYMSDYNKVSPAASFQSLVTDRQLETDTSKWVTRLYYPVFF